MPLLSTIQHFIISCLLSNFKNYRTLYINLMLNFWSKCWADFKLINFLFSWNELTFLHLFCTVIFFWSSFSSWKSQDCVNYCATLINSKQSTGFGSVDRIDREALDRIIFDRKVHLTKVDWYERWFDQKILPLAPGHNIFGRKKLVKWTFRTNELFGQMNFRLNVLFSQTFFSQKTFSQTVNLKKKLYLWLISIDLSTIELKMTEKNQILIFFFKLKVCEMNACHYLGYIHEHYFLSKFVRKKKEIRRKKVT
jgi:hypothetical protein